MRRYILYDSAIVLQDTQYNTLGNITSRSSTILINQTAHNVSLDPYMWFSVNPQKSRESKKKLL